jgi:4'-phosphopantetheinyl transferase EntD
LTEFPVPHPTEGVDQTGDLGLAVSTDGGVALIDVDVLASLVSKRSIETLIGDEREIVSKMAPARAAEFATGRRLLRNLLGLTGPLPRGHDGRPVYPVGTPPASMSHDGDVVIAVAHTSRGGAGTGVVGIGVDICGFAAANTRGVIEQIVRPDEGALDPTCALVIKEASFKATSPALRRRPTSFLELFVTLHPPSALDPPRARAQAFTTSLDGRAEPLYGALWTWGERWCAVAVALA